MTTHPLLADLVRQAATAGRPVTARSLARRLGADRVRVAGLLDGLARQGVVRRYHCTPDPARPTAKPFALYLTARKRKPCRATPSSGRTPGACP